MDEAHVEIEGYGPCDACGRLHLVAVMKRTGGQCPECVERNLLAKTRYVEIVNRGQLLSVREASKKKRWSDGNKGSKETKRKGEKARLRAMNRLRHIFPEVFQMLLAEERAAVGLDPWPLERLQSMDGVTASQTMNWADIYAALDEQGVGVDGDPAEQEER